MHHASPRKIILRDPAPKSPRVNNNKSDVRAKSWHGPKERTVRNKDDKRHTDAFKLLEAEQELSQCLEQLSSVSSFINSKPQVQEVQDARFSTGVLAAATRRSHHSASLEDATSRFTALDGSNKHTPAPLTLRRNTTDPLPKLLRSSSLASIDSKLSAAASVYPTAPRSYHSASIRDIKSRVRSERLDTDAAALRTLQRSISDPLRLSLRSVASADSKSSNLTDLSVRRKVPRALKPPGIHSQANTNSGSRFYAAVIRSAVKKVDQTRQVDQARPRKEHKYQLDLHQVLADRQPPSRDMVIVVVLALFPIVLLVACLVVAFSLVHDE